MYFIYVCIHKLWVVSQSSEDIRSLRAGGTGSCELFVVGATNQTWILWRKCKCSEPLSHFSSPTSEVSYVLFTGNHAAQNLHGLVTLCILSMCFSYEHPWILLYMESS